MAPTKKASGPSKAAAPSATEIVETQDNEDKFSIPPTKISSETQSNIVVGSQVASGSNPISGPTNNSPQPRATSKGLEDPASNGSDGRAVVGPIGK
jgi:hypothetical protein